MQLVDAYRSLQFIRLRVHSKSDNLIWSILSGIAWVAS